MHQISALIVDDERMARENLHRLLEVHCPDINVVAHCSTVNEAKIAILERNPFVIFLDIKMPGENGLEMLQKLPNRQFLTIFVTAHTNHALEAFEEAALDYILKPIHSSRLKKAVARVVERFEAKNALKQDNGSSSYAQQVAQKISLPTGDGLELFDLESIVRFQAKGSTTYVYLDDGERLVIARNLKKLEDLVASGPFIRVHHAHLVNLMHVQRYSRSDGGFVIMSDGSEVEVSRRKKGELLTLLSGS